MAEAKPTAPEGAEIAQVLTYLREREQQLKHYSDKLRAAINRIVAMFGSEYYCSICDAMQTETKNGKPIHYRYLVHYTTPISPRVQSYFGNELPPVLGDCKVMPEKGDMCVDYKQKIAYAHENPDYHTFVPKIYISIPIIDEAPFYKDETEGYELRLMLEDGYLVAWDSRGGEYNTTHSITSLSREKIKALVKSGRIPAFLKLVQQKLDEKTAEYKQVAEMAERLMNAITQ